MVLELSLELSSLTPFSSKTALDQDFPITLIRSESSGHLRD